MERNYYVHGLDLKVLWTPNLPLVGFDSHPATVPGRTAQMYTASALNFKAHKRRLFRAPLPRITHLPVSSRMTSVALRPNSDSILQMILDILSLDRSLFLSVNSVVLVHSRSYIAGVELQLCLFVSFSDAHKCPFPSRVASFLRTKTMIFPLYLNDLEVYIFSDPWKVTINIFRLTESLSVLYLDTLGSAQKV